MVGEVACAVKGIAAPDLMRLLAKTSAETLGVGALCTLNQGYLPLSEGKARTVRKDEVTTVVNICILLYIMAREGDD